jgi:hypothetical protein
MVSTHSGILSSCSALVKNWTTSRRNPWTTSSGISGQLRPESVDNLPRNTHYSFHVVDASEETREFTVKVQSEAFRSSSFKFQDGPGICFARLKQELEEETQESRAEADLHIGKQDIDEYLERHYPRKRR